jgi:hypothetical protein
VVVYLVVGSSGATAPQGSAGPPPSGRSVRFEDESSTSADSTVTWRTFWVLCWDPYPGADSYEIRTLTG